MGTRYDASMFQLGTISSWWPVARRCPPVRDLTKSVLKTVGYAALVDHIETRGPARVLEFGHSATSPLFTLFGEKLEMWGLDAVAGASYNTVRALEQFRARYTGCTFIDGLFGAGADEKLPDAAFDLVCSVSVIEHIPEANLPTVLNSIRRILKPGGVFLSSYDVFWGHPVKPMFDAVESSGLAWLTPREEMDVCWCRWLNEFTPERTISIMRQVAFEDGRRVLEGFLGHLPEEQRRFGQAVTILVGASRPA